MSEATSNSKEGLTGSRFAMWRGVVVMIHADNVVTPQELCFINDYLKDMNLSATQKQIIEEDLQCPRNAHEIFSQITVEQDKIDFFALARAVAWCDGDFVNQERQILELLEDRYLTEENMSFLKESRSLMTELELCQNEWNFKTDHSKSFFGFLKKNRA